MQATWDDYNKETRIRQLTDRSRQILSLLGEGNPQAVVAKRLQLSTATVCNYTKELESLGLIQRKQPKLQSERGKRQRTIFYELSDEAKARAKRNPLPMTSCRVHHIGIKYSIKQSSQPVKDKRTGFSKAIKMKGPERKVYWFPGRAGYPSVSITWHPGTLMCWVDKGQSIPAASIQDAERLGDEAITAAKDKFIRCQGKFGVQIIADSGKMIGQRHYGFAFTAGTEAEAKGVTKKDWFMDRSNKEVDPSLAELETTKAAKAIPLDNVLQLVEDIGTMPDLIKQTISPIGKNVEAMMQGGRPIEVQLARALDLIERLMERLDKQDEKIRRLEGRT